VPEIRFINHYHDAPGFIAAGAASIREHWEQHGKGDHLLISFHGLPKSTVENGDPYHSQCLQTAQLLAEALELPAGEWSVAFQSRVGREEWLQPYTEGVLEKFGQEKMSRVDVVCPGFSVDCLETLEEIAIRYAEIFVKSGGGSLSYIPALNARNDHVTFLSELVASNVCGWPESSH
jgi:ferrochelatase